MNTNPESFEAVRKLMAVKRHEAPPPGYFNTLSGKIVSRIERGEGQLNFWERLSTSFTLRPAFAYAFAVAAFGAFTASVFYSGKASIQEPLAQEGPATAWATAAPHAAFASQMESTPPLHVPNWLGNTNPGAPPQSLPSLFAPQGRAVPVSYQTGN
ncbi:MAG: hypothetical protein ABSH38_01520 [Verrucomicrobiota bacterium]|jgi:hypothetical protein